MSALFQAAWYLFLRRWIIRVTIIFFTTTLLAVLLFKWVNPPTTLTMISQRLDRGEALKREWVPIEKISKNMQLAVICGEDGNFTEHHGFDFAAIKAAMKHNERGGKVRGASTISQQTAKNVFLWNGRSYIRKGLEAYFTVLIEFIWGKNRIMEVYLNVAETGPGIFGAEAAAQEYYNKSADALSKNQAAGIASIFPAPRRWKIGGYPAGGRQKLILRAMNRRGSALPYLN